jgi:hypothetical protein
MVLGPFPLGGYGPRAQAVRMAQAEANSADVTPPRSRRWLVGMEPIFEGGWLHRGRRAQHWSVEDELVAVAILGDVTVDLAQAKTLPAETIVKAYALGRDVDILVDERTHVALSSRPNNDHVSNEVPAVAEEQHAHVVRIQAHTGLGDVNVRVARRAN